MRRTALSAICLVALFVATVGHGAPAKARAQARKDTKTPRVVLVSVDGLRADLASKMTFFLGMKRDGAWTFDASAHDPAITVVSHAAMFTGRLPSENGVKSFEPSDGKLDAWRPLKVGTIFDAAKAKGLATAAFTQKKKLDGLLPIESVGETGRFSTSERVVDWACSELETDPGKFDLAFIHFKDVDEAGHSRGWLSKEQLEAVERIDERLEELSTCLEAAEAASGRPTLLIVTSDHGGHDRTHGKRMDVDRKIPWAARGPGIAAGVELKGVTLVDTAAVIDAALGLGMKDLDGSVPDGLYAP